VRLVAIFSLAANGQPTDRRARLWAQTERLRSSLLLAALGSGPASEAAAIGSFRGLQGFLGTPVKGLWYDWQAADGSFEVAPAPASTLYHLMTGLSELLAPSAFKRITKT
jgi:mannose/cellobiose epimerase-like protein (N-acyl-D-glucosamine 2-epimerase family)